MKNYSLKSCELLIDTYVNEYKGEASILEEGCLGLGKVLLYGADGYKSIVITEYYINPWVSGHKVRKYNKLPKKYEKMLEII
jgi:hypothetical protein